jgi:prevent-host-death family protein
MQRVELDKDIQPISEFRSKATMFVDRVHKTKRPLVITNHGKSAAVLMDVGEYEKLMGKMELLKEIRTAEDQIMAGRGIEHEKVKKDILGKYK